MSILSFDVGIKNLAFCVLKENKILNWNVSTLKNASTNQSMCEIIVEHLDKFPEMLQCNTVLIEKQPSKNNKMRIIEALLNTYFVIKGSSNTDSSIKKIVIYSAKYKLGDNTLKGKVNYSERKKLSVSRCKAYLDKYTQDENFIEYFDLSKKKDDLADCLLQALAYSKSNVFDELQNISTTLDVVPRKPTQNQEKKGYSRSNIKYILMRDSYSEENCPVKLKSFILKFYKNVNEAYEQLHIFREV